MKPERFRPLPAFTIAAIFSLPFTAGFSQVVPQPVELPPPGVPALPPVPMMRLNQALIAEPAGPRYEIHRLTQIKLDIGDEGPRFICMMPRYVKETQKVRVTRFEMQEKAETVQKEVNGVIKEVTLNRTIAVPVTQEVERTVMVARGKKPTFVAWDEAKLYHLDGKQLSLEDAKQALKKLTTVFLAQGLEVPLEPADKLQRAILSESALVFVTDALQDAQAAQRFAVPARVNANNVFQWEEVEEKFPNPK